MGACTRNAPCKTFGYALTQTSSTRNVIHVLGQSYDVGATVSFMNFDGYLDGENTVLLQANTEGTSFSGGTVTITSVSIGAFSSYDSDISLVDSVLLGRANASGGKLTIDRSSIPGGVFCAGTKFVVTNSVITSGITARVCDSLIERNVIQDAYVQIEQGFPKIDNNVFVSTLAGASTPLLLSSISTGIVEFNTIVNSSGSLTTAPAVSCPASVAIPVTSNILAWNSSAAPACPTTYSLYDKTVSLPLGVGNLSADPPTVFESLSSRNFHLATGSPAIGAAEPNAMTPSTDFDVKPRPSPAGSTADIGAYEAQ